MINFMTKVAMTAFMVASMDVALANDLDDLTEMSLEELLQVRIVTIATGTEQTVAEAAAVTTVITADDIEAMGATDLDEVLETVPGLHVARNSLGYNPIYTIRGIYSAYNPETLVLINGLPINTVQTGNRGLAWAGMPIKAISRIEVIRGPGSAVYGADAFAGVINIITKNANDIDGSEVGVRAGKFNAKDGWALHGKQYGDVDVAVMLEYHETDGHDAIVQEDAQTQFDNIFGTGASLAPGPVSMSRQNVDARVDVGYKKNWKFRAGYQGRYDVGTGIGLAQALDPVGRYSSERVNADLNYHSDAVENWVFDAQLAFLDMNYEAENNILAYPPNTFLFGRIYPSGIIGTPGVSERHTRLNLSTIYSGIENHSIRLGTGYHYADMYKVVETKNFGVNPITGQPLTTTDVIVDLTDTPYAFLPETNRSSQYAFIQDTWDITEKWQLTTGLRYDHYSDFGNTVNPRLALVWKPNEDWIAKLLYGRAFRAPAFTQLYSANNPVTLGNPNLKPEQIETYEFALNYNVTKDFNIGFNSFTYDITDAIRYIGSSTKAFAQNAGTQQGKGFELEAEWKLGNRLRIVGNYAFQDSTDDTSLDVANAPKQQVYVRGDWRFYKDWHLNTQLNKVGNRNRVLGDDRPPLGGYTTVDLTVYGNLYENTNIKASIRNVFDEAAYEPSLGPNYKLPYDLPLAGRSYYLELNYKF